MTLYDSLQTRFQMEIDCSNHVIFFHQDTLSIEAKYLRLKAGWLCADSFVNLRNGNEHPQKYIYFLESFVVFANM